MRTIRTVIILAVMAALGGTLFVYSGLYNVAATVQHTAPVYWLLNVVMRQSVQHRARAIRSPPLDDGAMIEAGARLYRVHCVQCHGAPGIAPAAFALGLMPLPANLSLTARDWNDPAELYWVVKHGIKTSGMPAWEFRLAEADLWAVVAFVNVLPGLGTHEYRAMTARDADAVTSVVSAEAEESDGDDGDAARGQIALQQYACVTCHVIPGVVGASFPVGPSLAGIANRTYLAGILPNTRETMIQWLRSPQAIAPGSAMPDLGVSERDARDIAAYLETLK